MVAWHPPKKFTDDSRSEIRAEWLEWHRSLQEELKEDLKDEAIKRGYHDSWYWPGDWGKDLGEGAWILVVEEPMTEVRQRFRIPTPSLWFAKPAPGGKAFTINKGTVRALSSPPLYKAMIQTPGGTLWLYPHEYVVCDDPFPLITDPDCTIHSLGNRAPVDEEQLFYLQSRGWSDQDAMLALLEAGSLDASEWGWVEFPEYARAAYEGVGTLPRFDGRSKRSA